MNNWLFDYFEWLSSLELIFVPRELKISTGLDKITAIIGPRRSGKSTFLLSLRKKDELYLNLEDPRIEIEDGKDILKIIYAYEQWTGEQLRTLYLDEIQELREWEKIVRGLHDIRKFRLVLTGSSSKLLSKEIATQLRGRTLTYLLFPFSFRESLKAWKIDFDLAALSERAKAKILRHLQKYLEYGGFPEVVIGEEMKDKVLLDYLDYVFLKDFVERHQIKNTMMAKRLFYTLIGYNASKITDNAIYKKVKGNTGFSKETFSSYMNAIFDTLVFFSLNPFSWKPHLREAWPKKLYLVDPGLYRVVKFSRDIGKLMENVAFLHLYNEFFNAAEYNLFYFHSTNYEVDFVVKHGPKVEELIQVTYASEKDEIPRRELRSLLKAADLLKAKHLTVITWDYEDEEKREGKIIRYVPLWRWLLTQ